LLFYFFDCRLQRQKAFALVSLKAGLSASSVKILCCFAAALISMSGGQDYFMILPRVPVDQILAASSGKSLLPSSL
jgi:hypothetical protein